MSVGRSVGLSVFGVAHSFDDPHVALYWPTWPTLLKLMLFLSERNIVIPIWAPNSSCTSKVRLNGLEFELVFLKDFLRKSAI